MGCGAAFFGKNATFGGWMDGGSCILGKTFWSVEVSDSGLEAYVEQNTRKIQIIFLIVSKNKFYDPIL